MPETIITNYAERELIPFCNLDPRWQKEFDYVEEPDQYSDRFFSYMGWFYDSHEFTRSPFPKWDGIQSDSFFSGILIRYSRDCGSVVVGRYCV